MPQRQRRRPERARPIRRRGHGASAKRAPSSSLALTALHDLHLVRTSPEVAMLGFGALAAVIGPKALVERRAWLASRLAALGLPAQDAVSSARV